MTCTSDRRPRARKLQSTVVSYSLRHRSTLNGPEAAIYDHHQQPTPPIGAHEVRKPRSEFVFTGSRLELARGSRKLRSTGGTARALELCSKAQRPRYTATILDLHLRLAPMRSVNRDSSSYSTIRALGLRSTAGSCDLRTQHTTYALYRRPKSAGYDQRL